MDTPRNFGLYGWDLIRHLSFDAEQYISWSFNAVIKQRQRAGRNFQVSLLTISLQNELAEIANKQRGLA